MSDMNRIRLLLADPFLTQSDVEMFEHKTGKRIAEELPPELPTRQTQVVVPEFKDGDAGVME
jgi:hypothetical protein